jgi:amidase
MSSWREHKPLIAGNKDLIMEYVGTVAPNSTIAELSKALEAGLITSVELVEMYLQRIAYYDRSHATLNAVPVLNPNVFNEARESDIRRSKGESLGPLEGIPFVAKDSYKVQGLPVAGGSPAFEKVIATSDAAAVEYLRAAGAIVLGKTTMPPMAAGGMQKGNFGRAQSPYNPDYMPAAWVSGSSNGSGVAVSASFGSFGLAEETLSSGRSPASNCGLATYTPSRGLISVRGNWPLLALRDVVAPYARTVEDLLQILNIIVREDPDSTGDLWRSQKVVKLPHIADVRPADFLSLCDPKALQGKVVGIPRLFVGKDSSINEPVVLRASVKKLWEQVEEDLRALGATVVEVDPPVFYEFDKLRPGTRNAVDRGYWSAEFEAQEFSILCGAGWDEFLRENNDPTLHKLEQVDLSTIYPEEFYGAPASVNPMPRLAYEAIAADTQGGSTPSLEVPGIDSVMAGLERFRTEFLESWMDQEGIDLLAFPAAADFASADADVSLRGALDAWRSGVGFSQGGWCLRPLGIPTVQVSMGTVPDAEMPVGVTFAGRAYSDSTLLSSAFAYEQHTRRRTDPVHAPIGFSEIRRFPVESNFEGATGSAEARLDVTIVRETDNEVVFKVTASEPISALDVTIDGERIVGVAVDQEITARRLSRGERTPVSGIQAGVLIAVARLESGGVLGAYAEFDQPTLRYLDTYMVDASLG